MIMKDKRRSTLNVLLPALTVGCLMATPLVSNNQSALFGFRLAGTFFGLSSCLRKTDDELSWLEMEKQQLVQERDDISKRYISDTEILELWVQEEAKRLEEVGNERIKQAETNFDMLLEDAFAQAEQYQALYLETKQQLEVYQLPRKPSGTSRLEVVSGRIIDFLYSHGILADYEDCWTENEFDLIRIKPRSGGKEQFVKLADEMQLELHLGKLPTFNISQGCIQIRLDSYGIDTKTVIAKPVVLEPQENFLKTIVETFNSFRVNGESGSGKSTFVRNLIALFNRYVPNVETVLIDPKYPMSEWDIMPKYKGIDEALDGLTEAAELVETRLKLARDDKDAGKKIRDFKPVLYIIDEIDWTITHYGQDAANTLRTTLKVGRALNVRILYIGQTPLASRLKMNRDDFRHSANFFLGENIPAAIEETCLSSSLKTDLEAQYVLRQESSDRYHMLVKIPGKQPYLSKLPKPIGNSGTPDSVTSSASEAQPELDGTSCNSQNPEVPVKSPDIERNLDFEKNGTWRNLEQMEDKVGSDEVPEGSRRSSIEFPVNMAETAIKLLQEGIQKTDIIKEYWGYKGRRYQLGKDLWVELNLPDSLPNS